MKRAIYFTDKELQELIFRETLDQHEYGGNPKEYDDAISKAWNEWEKRGFILSEEINKNGEIKVSVLNKNKSKRGDK